MATVIESPCASFWHDEQSPLKVDDHRLLRQQMEEAELEQRYNLTALACELDPLAREAIDAKVGRIAPRKTIPPLGELTGDQLKIVALAVLGAKQSDLAEQFGLPPGDVHRYVLSLRVGAKTKQGVEHFRRLARSRGVVTCEGVVKMLRRETSAGKGGAA